MDSINNIVESIDPDISYYSIALCETKKGGLLKKDNLSRYVIEKNLKQGKEGLMVDMREGTFLSIKEITDTEMKNIMTVKIEYSIQG